MARSALLVLLFILPFTLAHAGELYRVSRVVDGDTVVLDRIGKVRLIGVDTPETVHPKKPVQYFGREASHFLKARLTNKRVRIEYDQSSKDRFGRTLGYLYLEDGTFVNAEIIEQGYGFAYTRFPFKHLEKFRALERDARLKKRGLWSDRQR